MFAIAPTPSVTRASAIAFDHGTQERRTRAEFLIDPWKCDGKVVSFDREAIIIADGDEATYCFQINRGCARSVKLLEDGRRQVGEFLFAGDIFGWEAAARHDFAVEAVTSMTLQRFRRPTVEDHAVNDPDFARELRHYAASRMRMGRTRLVQLGRKTATERVAAFLLEMHGRLNGFVGQAIELPMSRADISDYLGLTVETVCRSLASLRRDRVIAIEPGRIRFLDPRRFRSPESAWLQ